MLLIYIKSCFSCENIKNRQERPTQTIDYVKYILVYGQNLVTNNTSLQEKKKR